MQYRFVCILAATLASGASADVAHFDFEEHAWNNYSQLVSRRPRVKMTITRPGALFGVQRTETMVYPETLGWGARMLSSSRVDSNAITYEALVIDFNRAILSFSIEAGDSGPLAAPESDVITLRAFSDLGGAGVLLDEQVLTWNGALQAGDLPAVLGVFGSVEAPIRSLTLDASGFGDSHSLFYDNIRVQLPAPGAITLPIGALLCVRRRRAF